MKQVVIFFSLMMTGVFYVEAQDKEVYMFSYFKNNGEDGLHLAYSKDGYTFTALKQDSSFLTPRVGKDKLMRDPCIIRGADGRFHMVWTVSWGERGIGYASSPDLVHWSEQRYLPVMQHEPGALNCWAPELTYDSKKKQYMIYWATTIPGRFPATDTTGDGNYNHRMYYTTTEDFEQFSPPEILYDKGFNIIDATIQPRGKKFFMFLKDETKKPVPQKNIRIAVSNRIGSGYSVPSKPITGSYWAEGPTAILIKGKWFVYFDKYADHRYGAVVSSNLKQWTDISGKISFPAGARHGTVFSITEKEFQSFFRQ
ncbi:glycoside hydrolase family 43 protein [Agriterribacter sp.]|uniref:glycoside hydrolase family 43 protein n=1 Tax=Agriterribacter sp. TaxID=2821509 RepID=UPI002CF587C0|nr:glycoside hydrolase family 43 protein [Agriterribacter sp.]HRO46438.1 glycoside hydrolase family 43 protein [Agriterribacter sp.]HRQ17337.1 glycoside hydrolase family 43 protein [Agriterribacter sp.]